jgi:hypothetical protein
VRGVGSKLNQVEKNMTNHTADAPTLTKETYTQIKMECLLAIGDFLEDFPQEITQTKYIRCYARELTIDQLCNAIETNNEVGEHFVNNVAQAWLWMNQLGENYSIRDVLFGKAS